MPTRTRRPRPSWLSSLSFSFVIALALVGSLPAGCAHRPSTGAASAPDGDPPPTRVVIVGAGLGGLITAYELEKAGISSHLIEMEPRLGGKVFTVEYAPGVIGEGGMQEIWEGSPLYPYVQELKVPVDAGDSGLSSAIIDGKLYAYTENSGEEYLKKLFTPAEKAAWDAWIAEAERLYHVAHEKGLTPELLPLQRLSMADWITKQLKLPPKVASFINLTISCELGANWISYSALIGVMEFRAFFKGGERALHTVGGNGELIAALGRAHKGPKSLGARVLGVDRRRGSDGKLEVRVHYLQNGRVRTVSAERVVLAVPWTSLHFIQITPPIDAARQKAMGKLGRGNYTAVHLLVDKAIQKSWGGGPGPFPVLSDGPLGVIYGIAEPSPASSPYEVFTILVHGFEADAWHMVPHDEKVKELLDGLDKLWPGFSSHVRHASTYPYHPLAVTYWPPGRSPLDADSQLLREPVDGLYFAADWVESSHSEGAAVAAKRVAQQIAAELKR